MKKWFLISALTLGLIGGGAGAATSHIDEASTEPKVSAPVVKTSKAKASVKGAKAAAVSAKVAQSSKAPVASVKPAAKTTQPASKQPASAASVKTQATASQTTAVKPAAQPTAGLAAYYGTWHNQAVTLTLSKSALTVAQPGQPSVTTSYQVTASGAGYLFTPTGVEADPLQLVLQNGQLSWVTGASAPLVLVR
ncbi:hypothetical protein [Lacticaseibacillus camelliae]|nr:hypothetical protein [Lacticaseibacillus camelliae]